MGVITAEEVKDIIYKVAASVQAGSLQSDVPLREQGVDSLDMMSILLSLEEKLGIKIPGTDVDALTTISGIVAYLNSKGSGGK